jgi:hypothetical protein
MSKGKKQAKPMSKTVTARLEELRRRRGVRNLEKRFLIVCEDDKSAPSYFEALKIQFSLSAASVQVAGSGGDTQPIQVVEKAVESKKSAARTDSGTVPFDHVWCVIDGDYGDKIQNARAKAQARGIKLAISTMCFEYWVLLHFEESGKPTTDCDGLVRSLKHKHIPKYEKGKYDFHEVDKDVRVACKRAEKLRKPGIDRGELPEDQNPCSEIYLLVNAILDESEKTDQSKTCG